MLPPDTDLLVPAGTELRFSENSILYTTGAIKLIGEFDRPVLLTAQRNGWGGIVVLKAKHQSLWQYAVVEKTTGIDRSGWTMTGGITFFQSDIVLDHVQLGNNQTEDAINVIHSQFDFRDSVFSNTFSDAFDSDFSNGNVTNCHFDHIAGDAVDVSGTVAVVSQSTMEHIGDKGVSAGEQSQVTVEGVTINDVGIGIASKDLSEVKVLETQISDARFYALAAYNKKASIWSSDN